MAERMVRGVFVALHPSPRTLTLRVAKQVQRSVWPVRASEPNLNEQADFPFFFVFFAWPPVPSGTTPTSFGTAKASRDTRRQSDCGRSDSAHGREDTRG